MNTRVKVITSLLGCCCWGLACSQTAGTANQNGGAGGSGRTGGSTGSAVTGGSGGGVATGGIAGSGATGGIGAGGTTAGSGGGSGGTSLSGQGGSATGGAGTAGNGSGGSGTGGGGGSKASGTGGTSLGGSGGAGTAGSGSGGQGTGGAGSGGLGGTGTGGAGGGSSTGGKGTGGAGTGGTSGGTGTGGTATGGTTGTGGATSSLVVPKTDSVSGRDSFAFGDVVFEVDPKVGARVATLSLSGANMIATIAATDTDNTTWGGVFWTSPQKAWDSNWPPPAALDSDPYTDSGTPGSHLVLDSGTYTALGVSVSKDFSADAGTSWITIVYTIKASKALQAAPWENCRVPRGGLAFFPAGASLAKGPLTMTQSASMVWFDDASKTATSPSGAKAIADGSGGWSAYALNGNLFLRKFTNTAASAQAPGEGQDEIYPGSGFLELEVQGPYTSIPAGGSLVWTIAWRIVKIPTSVTVSAGSTTLADFAKQQAAL